MYPSIHENGSLELRRERKAKIVIDYLRSRDPLTKLIFRINLEYMRT